MVLESNILEVENRLNLELKKWEAILETAADLNDTRTARIEGKLSAIADCLKIFKQIRY